MSGTAHRPVRSAAGGQQQQEQRSSAGLLVEVIRTLTTSRSEAQKELQKERLEKDFLITGQTIDKLLNANQQDLSASLQSFRKVSSQLTTARQRVRSAKDALSSCKVLLQCKRDELKKLWLESAEQKHLLRLLDQIEIVKSVPRDVADAMSKKLYLRAAEQISTADISFDGTLNQVEALRETKDILNRRKQELFSIISTELNRQLYIKPSEDLFFELGRVASMRRAGAVLASDESASRLNLPPSVKSLTGAYLKASEDEKPILRDDGCPLEDDTDTHRDASPVQYMATLIEACTYIRRLPDLADYLKRGMASGLANVVHHTSVYAREYLVGPELSSNDNRLLAELLQLLFRQFKIVVVLHSVIVAQMKRVRETRRLFFDFEGNSYSVDNVWEQIQFALQQVLNDYLDIKNAGPLSGLVSAAVASSNNNVTMISGQLTPEGLSVYFAKRRPARGGKKSTLFQFDSTAHAMKVASYVREQKLYTLPTLTVTPASDANEQFFICQPTPENAIVIFKPLMKFVQEIEARAGGAPSNLRTFMEDYIRTNYLPKVQGELVQKLESILLSGDAWETTTADASSTGTPILSSTVRAADTCRNLEVLAQSAPNFAPKFGQLWVQVLCEYKRVAQTVYDNAGKSMKQEGNVEVERRKISAAWAVDEDIGRLLKSLPNWMALTDQAALGTAAVTTPFSPPNASSLTPMMESADDIRQRNQRESEILIGNLGMQKRIEEHEVIIDDPHTWRLLANMHESIEYLCRTMRMYWQQLPSAVKEKLKERKKSDQTTGDGPFSNQSFYEQFDDVLYALDDLASVCLLMLHLEVRVHCFYFLLPIAKQTAVSRAHGEDIDEQVVKLNKDLSQTNELLIVNLQSRKVKYVFEGIGHLVSAIFVNSGQYIAKINDSGKKRMCKNIFSIQQCLSSITGTREQDLDSARRYFELLYSPPDDILNTILEKGAEFTEMEYQNLLALSIRSHPIYSSEPGSLEMRVSRLREIMNERSKK